MHKTDVVGLPGNPQPVRSARRFGSGRAFALLAALLVMAPAALSTADTTAAPPAAPPSAGAPPAAAPPSASAPAPTPPSRDIVLMRIDVYGSMISAVKSITKKGKETETKVKSAKLLSLVVTSSDPLPVGKQGTLFRKIEKPGDPAATTWVKVAVVTLKKVDATNKMDIDVVSEEKDVLVNGKKADHFAKGTKIKLQIDVEVPQ